MDKNNAWQLQVTNVLKSNIILKSLTSLLFLQQISFSSRDTLTLNRFMTFICSSAIKRCHRVPRESAAGEAILNSGILRQTRLCLYLRLRTNVFLCESVNSIGRELSEYFYTFHLRICSFSWYYRRYLTQKRGELYMIDPSFLHGNALSVWPLHLNCKSFLTS